MSAVVDSVRDARVVAIEVDHRLLGARSTEVELVDLPRPGIDEWPDFLGQPYTERCDGCEDGTLAARVEPAAGPCDCCWGTGRTLFAWTSDHLRVLAVPPAIAAPYLVAAQTEGVSLR